MSHININCITSRNSIVNFYQNVNGNKAIGFAILLYSLSSSSSSPLSNQQIISIVYFFDFILFETLKHKLKAKVLFILQMWNKKFVFIKMPLIHWKWEEVASSSYRHWILIVWKCEKNRVTFWLYNCLDIVWERVCVFVCSFDLSLSLSKSEKLFLAHFIFLYCVWIIKCQRQYWWVLFCWPRVRTPNVNKSIDCVT